MSVHAQLGNKKNPEGFFEHGFKVLAEITQTRDEDIRQALLEHIEQEPALPNPTLLAMKSRAFPVSSVVVNWPPQTGFLI
jgi:hypothetical protein